MQFNSDSDGQDLVSLCDDLVHTNSTSYALASKTRAANQALRTIWSWIYEAYGGWVYDDHNQTDLPTATANLVSGQESYSLPANTAHILGVSVLDSAGTTWHKLSPITLEQIQERQAESEFLKTNGEPRYYRLVGDIIKLYPAANYSGTSSLRVDISRDISAFASTDTTKVPGFDTQFHELVAIFMALQYARREQLAIRTHLEEEWKKAEGLVKRHYTQKFREMFPARFQTNDTLLENI